MTPATWAIVLGRVALGGALATGWEIASRTEFVDPDLLPPPSEVAAALVAMLARPAIQADLLLTAAEIAVTFLLSLPVGVFLGLLSAESAFWGRVLNPLLFFLFGIPKSIFLPLFILGMGIGFWQKVGFGVFSTFLIIVLNTAAAVHSVSPAHALTARAYGATKAQVARWVYLPSMLPVLLEGLRLAVVFSFTAVVLAEMYASRSGIGHQIASWGENFDMRRLIAGATVLAVAAILASEAIRMMERRFSQWRT